MNANRIALHMAFVFLAGAILFGTGQIWSLRNATRFGISIDELGGDLSPERLEELVNQAKALRSHARTGHLLEIIGMCIACPAYLGLIFLSTRSRWTPWIFKGILWLPAAAVCVVGIRMFPINAPLGIMAVFMALLLILPNGLITKNAGSFIGYVAVIHMLLFLWFYSAVFRMIEIGFHIRPLSLLLAICSVISSAVLLSSGAFYARKHPDSLLAKWGTCYRWMVIITVAISSGLYALASTAETIARHREEILSNKVLNSMDVYVENLRKLDGRKNVPKKVQ
ncbi:MAG: hypothetical protein PHG65_07250 [Kiritimatiellae bacterium]|nr:hypothetical protein [Kiritimatiellia bacterium]